MSLATYLRFAVVGGLFLVPFIPFLIAGQVGTPALFFPYITVKNFAFRIVVEFVLLAYVLLALREPKYRPRGSLLMWSALAFVLWMGVATLFSADPEKSFWSNFERMEGYVGLLHLFVYFVIASAVLSAANLWERFLNTTVGASVIMGCIALLQLFGVVAISSQSGPRVDTTFGNAIYTAVYMLVHVFLTLFLIAQARGRGGRSLAWWYTFYGIALVLQVVTLYYTQTRGALLGLVVGLLVVGLYIVLFARGKEYAGLRRVAAGGLAAVILLAGGFFAARNTSFVEQNPTLARLASISLEDATTQARLFYIWPMALKGIAERPIAGWGQENFSFVFNKNYAPAMFNQEQWFDRAHNQFLDWFLAGGIPAGLLYLALYALAAWAVVRAEELSPLSRAALLGFLAGFAVNNLTVFDNLMSAVLFMTVLGYIHALSRRELPGSLFLSRSAGDKALAVAAPAVAAVVIFGAWSLNAAGLARAGALVYAVTQEQGEEPQKTLAQFKEAVAPSVWPDSPLGAQEAAEQLMQFASNSAAPAGNLDPQVKQEFYAIARSAGLERLAARPGDARIELFFGAFLSQFGQLQEALNHLQTALSLSPKKQQIIFQMGFLFLQAGDREGSTALFKQSFELEPRYDFARILYAGALYREGRNAEADALIAERWGTLTVDNEQLVRIYLEARHYDRLVAIWQERLENKPNDIDLHLGLAEIYFLSGRSEDAIKELERVAQLNPAQAAEMRSLINQIRNGSLKP